MKEILTAANKYKKIYAKKETIRKRTCAGSAQL